MINDELLGGNQTLLKNDTNFNSSNRNSKETTKQKIKKINDAWAIHKCKYKYFYLIFILCVVVFIIVYILNLLAQNNIFIFFTEHKNMFQTLYSDVKYLFISIFTNSIGALIMHFIHLLTNNNNN